MYQQKFCFYFAHATITCINVNDLLVDENLELICYLFDTATVVIFATNETCKYRGGRVDIT